MTRNMSTGQMRTLDLIILALVLSGCSGLKLNVIKPNQATIDPKSSVVVFSVNTSTLQGCDRLVRPRQLSVASVNAVARIQLSEGKSGLQRYVIEVPTPGQTVVFNYFAVAVGREFLGSGSELFRTIGGSPRVQLTPGAITYVGRLEVEEIQFEVGTDKFPCIPTAIKLVFSDALEDDLLALKDEYKLLQNRITKQHIVGYWAPSESEYLPLQGATGSFGGVFFPPLF